MNTLYKKNTKRKRERKEQANQVITNYKLQTQSSSLEKQEKLYILWPLKRKIGEGSTWKG